MMKKVNTNDNTGTVLMLFWFFCMIFSSRISAQIFITGHAEVTDIGGNIKVPGKIIDQDSLQYAQRKETKIYIVEGTEVYNLTNNTTASIAYISPVSKSSKKVIAKNDLRKKAKQKVQKKELQNGPLVYNLSNETGAYATGKESTFNSITNTNNFSKYILNGQKGLNIHFILRIEKKITLSDNKIHSRWKRRHFSIRPPPFHFV